ncbi:MAG: hypothetical protein QM808_14320 [Steroidobacteraceae bacterium]
MKRGWALCACAIGLSGCATPMKGIRDVDINELGADQALLVLSTAADETCVSFSSAILLREAAKGSTPAKNVAVYQLNNKFVKSDFQDEYGKVWATVLPPGEYDFALSAINPFMTYSKDETDSNGRYDPAITKAFSLSPRSVKYVGEIHSDGCGSVLIHVRDRRQRDIKFLSTTEPKLASKEIEYDILVSLREAQN